MLRAVIVSAAVLGLAAAAGHLRSFDSRSGRRRAQVGGSCTGTTYDLLEMELQYPIALCKDGVFDCTYNATYFTLHGLWAEDLDGNYPCYCTNQQFDPSQVADLLPQMNAFWPSLNGPANTFWAHEYEKHATCEEDIFPTEHDFFAGTLNLLAKYNVTPALAAAGIYPSNTKGFTLAAFKAAYSTAYGGAPIVSCNSQGHVEVVTVCVNKTSLAVQDCPSFEKDSCSSSTLYLLQSM